MDRGVPERVAFNATTKYIQGHQRVDTRAKTVDFSDRYHGSFKRGPVKQLGDGFRIKVPGVYELHAFVALGAYLDDGLNAEGHRSSCKYTIQILHDGGYLDVAEIAIPNTLGTLAANKAHGSVVLELAKGEKIKLRVNQGAGTTVQPACNRALSEARLSGHRL